MEMGAGFPDEFASILRMRNAGCAAGKSRRRWPAVTRARGYGEHAQIIWLARRRRPSRCVDPLGNGWVLSGRLGPRGVCDVQEGETRGGSEEGTRFT